MSNLVLYRKYRPQIFSEFVGQEHVVTTLTNAILSGMISHAYLFCGPKGSGKTTIARLLAKAINCEKRGNNYEPCNKCSACLEITQGNAIDLIEIDAASNRGIDDIRELRDGIRFTPTKLKYKVFIIDESHQLTKDAANALLKTLEEPPSHAIFILATTETHKMIPTIVSRCQRFDFRRLTLAEIIKRLETLCRKEKVKADKAALELIAINARGSLRDAESLLDQAITFSGNAGEGKGSEIRAKDIEELLGIVEINLVSQFVDFIIKKQAGETIDFLNKIVEKEGRSLQEFTRTLINYFRQILIFKIDSTGSNSLIVGLTAEETAKIKSQADSLKQEEIQKILRLFIEAEEKMKYSSIPQLPLELAIIDAIGPKEQ